MDNKHTIENNPLVSVIIPAYNRETLIGETLDSILTQTYPNWECIIVDDGSTDHTIDVIEKYTKKDNRFRLFKRNREPKGAPTCRNIGLDKSKGEYVIFLDSDDLLSQNCIDKRLLNIERYPDYDFWAYPMLLFNDQRYDLNILSNVETGEDVLDRFLSRDQLWLMPGPIWRIDKLRKIGGFDEKLKSQQDLEIHTRAIILGLRFKFFDRQPDSFYRQNIIDQPFRGDNAYTMAQLDNYTYLINKLRMLLKKNDLLNPNRKLLLKRFLFWNLVRWKWFYKKTFCGAIFKPQINWFKAYMNGLINFKELTLGALFFIYETLKPHEKITNTFLRNTYMNISTRIKYLDIVPSKTMAKMKFVEHEHLHQ